MRRFGFNTNITVRLGLTLALLWLVSSPSTGLPVARAAGPWYVAPGGDDGNDCLSSTTPCATINGAIAKASPGDTIYVAIGAYTDTGNEVILLDKDVTLSGGWEFNGTLGMQSGTSIIDGEGSHGGITVNSGVTATVEGFVVQNSNVGGIYNTGALTLTNSTISSNGDGIGNFGGAMTLDNSTVSGNMGKGIYNMGTMTLYNSTVSGNMDDGICNMVGNTLTLNNSTVSGNMGGGIHNESGSTLTLNNSAVSGNTTPTYGDCGGIYNSGNAALSSSTISGNAADGYGGGICNSGALILDNSTVSGNTANGAGGGILNWYTTLTLNNSTVSGNTASGGGGIYNYGSVTLQNTILAGNATSGTGPDCVCYGSAAIGSSGHNLIGDTSGCTFTPGLGDLTNVDPKLGPLEGSPGYHPLLPSSPAIDAGNPVNCTDSLGDPLSFDQRGMSRVGRCDIGAYEFGVSAAKQAVGAYTPGGTLTYIITLDNDVDTDITGILITDTLPLSLAYVPDSFSASNGIGGEGGGVITWNGTVSAGSSTVISFRATVDNDVPSCSFITNKALISAGAGYGFERRITGATPCACNLAKDANNPVLSIGTGGGWDDEDVWSPTVLEVWDVYKMWYTGYDGSNPSQIGLATSTNGVDWTKDSRNPVLSPSQTWEESVIAGCVIFDGGIYKMWYTGFDSSGVGRIGYATSVSGVAWTKHGGNPVLDVGASGSWEDDDVKWPSVIKEGNIYHMWYEGYDGITARIGHAISGDGINWTRDAANPILDVGPVGDWDWLQVYSPSVVAYGDVYLLWYSGGTLPTAWQTGYAISSNGSDWVRRGIVIAEGVSGTFDADGADYPSVILDGDSLQVWYTGMSDGGTYNIGYATAEICSQPSAVPPTGIPVYLPIVMKALSSQPPCPLYYTDDFSDPGSGWPVYDDSSVRFAYTSGQYQIWLKEPSLGWRVTPGAKATDFVVTVTARRTSGTYGVYGIIFGLNEDWSELYQVHLDANYYSIWRYDHGDWTALEDWTPSGHIKTGTNWNRLKVIRDGADITVYVNGQHLTTVTDDSFTGLRRIGLVAYSPSSGALDTRFDDFALYPADYPASCGVSAAVVGFEMGVPDIHWAPAPPSRHQPPVGH